MVPRLELVHGQLIDLMDPEAVLPQTVRPPLLAAALDAAPLLPLLAADAAPLLPLLAAALENPVTR